MFVLVSLISAGCSQNSEILEEVAVIRAKLDILIPDPIEIDEEVDDSVDPESEDNDIIDPDFDLSEFLQLGFLSKESVDAVINEAFALYEEGNYRDAAVALNNAATDANRFANILSKMNRPYYSARSSNRDDLGITTIRALGLAEIEGLSNSYKEIRNEARLLEGLCYYHLGNYVKSLPLLLNTLDLIEITQVSLWREANIAILDMIGVTEIVVK